MIFIIAKPLFYMVELLKEYFKAMNNYISCLQVFLESNLAGEKIEVRRW